MSTRFAASYTERVAVVKGVVLSYRIAITSTGQKLRAEFARPPSSLKLQTFLEFFLTCLDLILGLAVIAISVIH